MLTTRWLCSAIPALVAILIAGPSAEAQELRVGDRIRISATSVEVKQLIGTYLESDGDNLVLHTNDSGRYVIPWDDVSRLDLSRGEHSNAGKGALIGLGIGGGLGLVVGIAAAADDSDWYDYGAGDVLLMTVATGAMGAGIGALIGLASKSERWQTVPQNRWQIQVTPNLNGGVTVGVNLRL